MNRLSARAAAFFVVLCCLAAPSPGSAQQTGAAQATPAAKPASEAAPGVARKPVRQPPTPAQRSKQLEAAFKKEFVYLQAQRVALRKRLEQVRREDARAIARAQRGVDAVQGRVLRMTLEADRLEGKLGEAERAAGAVQDGADVVVSTLDQARASLKPHGLSVREVSPKGKTSEEITTAQAEELTRAFTLATKLLTDLQRVRTGAGAYFTPEGVKVKGTIVRVGNVAAYGVSAQHTGALAPAGGGRFKLWSEPADATAKALASGATPKTLDVFLFESLEKPVEEKKEKTLDDIMKGGGVVGWVIVVLGLIGLLLTVARVLILLWNTLGAGRLLTELEPLVRRGALTEAGALAARGRGATGRVLAATIAALERPREELEDCVAEAILHESPALERFGSTIAVFAAVAPLLGLLGTVTGMISTFDVITEYGTGDPKMLSGGISEALITTQLGLIVAIPLLLLGNVTGGLAHNALTRLERAALRVMNLAGVDAASLRGAGEDGDVSASDELNVSPGGA